MLEVLDAHLKSLHQDEGGELRELESAEQAAFDLGMQLRDEIIGRLDEHSRISEVFRRRPDAVKKVYANLQYGLDDPAGDTRRLTDPEARDRALRILDSRDAGDLSDVQKTQVEKMLRRDTLTARRILVTENEDYRSAWMKMVTDPHPVLTPEENRAVQAWYEFRAMGDYTTSAGGFGIPVFIDPSIILTAQETGNPFLSIAKQVTVNTTQWKGVSSARVSPGRSRLRPRRRRTTAPSLAQPTVSVHMARGFIPYSHRGRDGLPVVRVGDVARCWRRGTTSCWSTSSPAGPAPGEPKGILTAISATAG